MYADCIPSSEYSVDWENDAFSAEVGDWNGKYGLLEPDSDDMIYAFDGSFYEVTPDDMATGNYSVVFYCNDGQRAFCAPFNESSTATSQTIPSQGLVGYILALCHKATTELVHVHTVNDRYILLLCQG